VDAILRYYYYIELGIDAHKHVAPFREEWAGNALSLVSIALFRLISFFSDALIAAARCAFSCLCMLCVHF
jgi:hypothetical protein